MDIIKLGFLLGGIIVFGGLIIALSGLLIHAGLKVSKTKLERIFK